MSDLCSPMIMLLEEADAFWCFERLMRRLETLIIYFLSFSSTLNVMLSNFHVWIPWCKDFLSVTNLLCESRNLFLAFSYELTFLKVFLHAIWLFSTSKMFSIPCSLKKNCVWTLSSYYVMLRCNESFISA